MQAFGLKGHVRPVRMVKYNADGDLLFSCSDDASVVVWRSATGQMIGRIKCSSAVKCIDISTNSEYVLTAEVAAGFGLYEALTACGLHDCVGHLLEADPTEAWLHCTALRVQLRQQGAGHCERG